MALDKWSDNLPGMKHQRGWVALAVALSFAACTRTPVKYGLGNGGVPSSLGGRPDGTGGGSTTSASGGTGGGSTMSASGGTLGDGGAASTIGGTRAPVTVQQGAFVPTGNPTVTRTEHTATLLPNGMVLIAGGSGDFSDVGASAELYDPSTGIFTATGSMAEARSEHTATLLPSGKVLVAGGINTWTGVSVASAELYDPSPGRFTAAGSTAVTRASHTATMLPSGSVLIAGGTDPDGLSLASAELYDPSAGKFTAIADMTAARTSHTATMLPNGLVLIAGGQGNRSFGMTAELYDPDVGTFTATSTMVADRSYHTATMLPNRLVLIAGGEYFTGGLGATATGTTAGAELYDPEAGTFSATGSMTVPRLLHTATMLLDGKVLIAGGTDEFAVFASAELYDPEAGTFSATGSMVARREYHTATLLPDGNVLIVGLNWSAELYGASAVGGAADAGGSVTTGGTTSTGGVPAAGGATGTSAMTLAQACTKNCALASGVPNCSTTTTECEQNCMTTYNNTSAINPDLGQQYTAMMICIAANFAAYDYVCAKPNSPLNRWSPGPYTTCEDLICNWNCDDATHGDIDPWVDIRCICSGV
jgi:hypothetical protein